MIIAALAMSTATAAMPANIPDRVVVAAPVCQRTGPSRAAGTDGALYKEQGRPLTRRLDQEPNADVVAAVLYSEGQCSKPVVISRNKGMNSKRK